jgi:hypothetical protein
MKNFRVTALLSVLCFSPLFAAVEEQGSLAAVAPKVSGASDAKVLGIDLWGGSYGQALTRFDGRTLKEDGSPDAPTAVTTQITVSTPAFGPFRFEVTPTFTLRPNFAENRFEVQNPSFGLEGTVYDKAGLSVWTRMEFVAPLTGKSRAENLGVSPQILTVLQYKIGRSKFRFQTVISNNINFYDQMETSAGLYISPRLFYDVSDSFAVVGLFETTEESKRGGPVFALDRLPSNLGLGFRYTSANGKGLWIQPLFDVMPFGRMDATAHLAVTFGGPIL